MILKPIWLVEDSANDIELTLAALEDNHLANRVIVMRDGSEALEHLRALGESGGDSFPAVILLDIKMPKVSGIDVLRTIKADPRLKLPVVMLTSSREGPDMTACYELGANAYVVKPVAFEDFFEALKTLGKFWAVLNERPDPKKSEEALHATVAGEPALVLQGSVAHILHLEDSEPDRELVRLLLKDASIDCEITAVETEGDFVRSLNQESWDLILSDFSLPTFDGVRALAIAAKTCPSTPFIFVTGTIGEDIAVESLKSGATDYVLKQRMTRLVGSVRRALNERTERLRREKAEADLKKSEEQLIHQAYHDPLTDLPNRALVQDRLIQALSGAKRRAEKVAILFVDLDQFKFVNDSLGHSAGDLVLKQVAERLERCARKDDTVARLGGDEFVAVVSGVKDSTDAAFAANRIMKEMAIEFATGGTRLSATCSIGISVFPDDGEDSEILLKHADTAMLHAKENGRSQWQFFTPEMNRRAVERLSIEGALRLALKREQFFLEYQPQLELSTGKIVGAEALLRWRHPEEGLILPNRFIPIAENTGEIVPIGEWVLRTACAQSREWQSQRIPALKMAVNISAIQLRHGSLPSTIKKVLDETGLAPEHLELEITESLLLDRDEKMASQMRALRDLGLRMAIDDFGTGYSSFAYLRRFRFDSLKIECSFVQALNTGPNDAEITAGIIALGKILKMELIAECVETKEQLETLRALGCDQIQGYYFSRPLGASAFAEMVRRNHAGLPAGAGHELPA